MPQPQSPLTPLRIGLLVDSFQQPRWVRRIVEDMVASPTTAIVLVVKNSSSLLKQQSLTTRLWNKRRHLFYTAYTMLDEAIAKVSPDAFERVSMEDLLQGVPVIEVDPISQRFTDKFRDEDVEQIRSHQLDVALRFGFRILKGDVLDIAKHGLWSFHHDDGLVYRGAPPGFWEVMTGDPVTGSMLQVLTEELDNGRVIYRSWAPTINQFSVKRNTNNYYWKSAAFVMRKLTELHETGRVTYDQQCIGARPYSHRLFKTPGNQEMFRLGMRLAGRAINRAIEKTFYSEVWSLAYRFRLTADDPNNTFYKYKQLQPPAGRFWADPFPVKFGDRYFVFFEEFVNSKNKAHISMIELDGEQVTEPVPVLERPYHLSYPFIFEWNQTLYMVPETGANNTVELYRCTSFPHEWEFDRVLLEARNPTDATLVEFDGRWWMFVNIEEEGVTVNWEEMHVFHADTPLGPWTPNKRNPVKSDVRNSRPAGRLFSRDGKLFRPAQDCSNRYGYATVINEVIRITPDEFREKEVSRITPDWNRWIVGTHTLNSAEDLTVIDCIVRSNKLSPRRRLGTQKFSKAAVRPKKENVLQFIHGFIQGGSERQMIQLTRLLVESDRYHVHVAALNGGGVLRPEIDRLHLGKIEEFPLTSFYDQNMLVQLRRFAAFLKEHEITLIHTHDFYSNVFGITGAALAGTPVRIGSRRETQGMRTAAQKRVERTAFLLAQAVVTNAEAVKRALANEGVSAEKISVIYNGLDLERLKPAELSRTEIFESLGLPASLAENRKFVTIVANLQHDVKDHPMFLRAARRIQQAVPEATFLLAGEGPLLDSMRDLAGELGIAESTYFLGRCSHVPDLLSISDVCVLSSKAEGFSNAILEYMAAGRAVVATDVGGAREALTDGETGYVVPSGDDETMAARIVELLNNSEFRNAMGSKAREVVERKFSCESQLNRTEALYEQLLAQHARRSKALKA